MIAQSIATRVADFLHRYPPFSYLSRADLEDLAATIQVRYLATNDCLFREGDQPEAHFFVLHKGRVEVQQTLEGEPRVTDVCDVGDSFGVRALLTGNQYVAAVRATEDSLVYAIPKSAFQPLLESNAKVAMFYAAGYAAGQAVVRGESRQLAESRRMLAKETGSATGLFQEEDIIVLKPTDQVVFCAPSNTVREAAEIMTEYKIGSIVVANENLHPEGILTHTDFTRKIGTGRFELHERVAKVMSQPVKTVPNGLTVAQIILTMMRNKIRHLVVTEDGTMDSRFIGIISEHDVLLSQGNNPAVLVKRMLKAREVEALATIRDRAESLLHNYLTQEVSIPFITATATEINDALIHRCIEMSLAEMAAAGRPRPDQKFVWLSLGSEGRGEQLLRTDQDNALLYEDPPEADREAVADWFLTFGQAVTDKLEACGFAHCPGEIMASNPRWNQPLSGWKKHFSHWIRVPEPKALMHGTIFFDFRAGYGDARLAERLRDHLFSEIDGQNQFLHFLAQNAMQNPPPLSFFNNFIVERGGEHKNEFDIKSRGMMPLADAARVLLLSQGEAAVTNTFRRYERLMELEPQNAELYEEAAMAYELMIRHRAMNGFERGDSGRFIDPKGFNKIERQTLKYAFRTIEALHSTLKTRFSLGVFG